MTDRAPWVLLRGLTRDARHWGDVPERLAAYPGERSIVCVDLPGNGTRAAATSPLAIGDYVTACRDAIADAGIVTPCHVLALSLGAMVAVEWARRHPRQLVSCVLVNTSLRPFGKLHWRLRPMAFRSLLGAAVARDAVERERAVLALTSRRFAATAQGEALARDWAKFHQAAPVSRANAVRQLFAAARYRCDAAPPVPITLLASTLDRMADVRCSRAIARAWNCPLFEHPDAGHDLPLDDPDWLAEHAAWAASVAETCAPTRALDDHVRDRVLDDLR
jgi:pimeloyl-ACP methyl ester carboxylesterase